MPPARRCKVIVHHPFDAVALFVLRTAAAFDSADGLVSSSTIRPVRPCSIYFRNRAVAPSDGHRLDHREPERLLFERIDAPALAALPAEPYDPAGAEASVHALPGRGRRGRPPGLPKVPGSGRKPGSSNKVTKPVREIAAAYTEEAIHAIAALARNASNEGVRLRAWQELLDRGQTRPRSRSRC